MSGWIALSDHKRSVLLVGGSPFTFILGRADLISFYLLMTDLQFYSRCDFRIILSIFQIKMDYYDKKVFQSSSNVTRYLTLDDRKKLFQVFDSERRTWYEQKEKDDEEQKLCAFFDDKQRVLCHD